MSLTSSGLLAKHTANIARLAQSFGLSVDNLDAGAKKKPAVSSQDSMFDQGEFKSKLHKMADDLRTEQQSVNLDKNRFGESPLV